MVLQIRSSRLKKRKKQLKIFSVWFGICCLLCCCLFHKKTESSRSYQSMNEKRAFKYFWNKRKFSNSIQLKFNGILYRLHSNDRNCFASFLIMIFDDQIQTIDSSDCLMIGALFFLDRQTNPAVNLSYLIAAFFLYGFII